MKSKTIGLYFGTFNPIHVGHLIIANYMADYGELDEVWFVVTPQNPLKDKASLLSDHHRLQLVRIAIEDNPRLKASGVEFDLPRPSYTVNTLAHLSEKHPDYTFCLIMGEDNLLSLHKWRNFGQIIADYELYVYPRVGDDQGVDFSAPLHPEIAAKARVKMMDAPLMKISASFIRKSIKDGHDVRYLLTEPVEKYVREMHFYTR